MYACSRAVCRLLIALLLPFLALPATGQARAPHQNALATAVPAWLYKGSDITPDPDWHFGVLPNGLRYAVRKNGVPPGQVAIRVRIDAGSLMERDSERGFAHLNEHLAFRGAGDMADGEAKHVWQRLGAAFGSDSNAQTTPTQTVYQLDLPSATQASLDESLHILAGMMEKPHLTQAEVDSERPVVLAEDREQPAPQLGYSQALNRVLFAGQLLADRLPSGNLKTLQAATPESVRAFHDRWYRPERAVVVVVGDLDPALFESLITKNFSSWQGVGPAPADPDFGKPDPSQPVSGSVAEPAMPPIVSFAVMRPWHFNADTVIFNQKRMIDQLAVQVINRRLETRARAGGSYLQANVSLDDISRSANGTFVSIVPIGDDWQAALKDVRAVIADAQAAPPSQAEIDRELAEYDSNAKNAIATASVAQGRDLADTMVQAVDIRETTTSPAIEYQIFDGARRQHFFTPAAVLASTRKVFQGDATRALVNTQKPDTAVAAELAAALKADVSGVAAQRAKQAAISFAKLPKLGKPATVTSREAITGFGMDKIVLSNGVRMIVYPNQGEKGRVYVRVRFGRGLNALPTDHETPAWAAALALVEGGIGSLGQDDLDALTSGRRIGMSFDVEDDAFSLSSMTSPADLNDQLRLIADKLAFPGWDPKPVIRARAAVLAGYAALSASPDGVLSRDLDHLLHAGDPRWAAPTRESADALTPAAFRTFWEPLLKTGPIEVQVFGDTTSDVAIAAVAKSLGALPPRSDPPPFTPPVSFPKHDATPVMETHDGPDNQAAGVIAWPTGGGIAGTVDSHRLEVLASVFSDRLLDRLRTEAGVSYSPSVSSDWPVGLPAGGRLIAVGKLPPDKLSFFFTLSREIAADLVAKPIGDDELARIKVPMLEALKRAASANVFWMRLMTGAAYDPSRIEAARALATDLSSITASQLQETARTYLRPDTEWTMEVAPKKVAAVSAMPSAGAQ